jgi:hypothetical protein
MTWISRYSTFSTHSRSDAIERRLQARYLPRFADMVRSEEPVLAAQRDVTRRWGAELGSTVRAVSYEVLPGVEMVTVLLDDDDFGPEIKWYFASDRPADYKHLVMAAEAGTEILAAGPPPAGDRTGVVDVQGLDGTMVRSAMFCFGFPTSRIVPQGMDGGWRPHETLAPAGTPPGVDEAVAQWPVTRAVRAWVVSDRDTGALTVMVQGPGAVSEPVLLMLRAQLEIAFSW